MHLSDPPKGIRWRYIFAVLGAIGMAIIYGLKVNLSVAIVAMLNHTGIAAAAEHEQQESGSHDTHHVVTDDAEESSYSCIVPTNTSGNASAASEVCNKLN